MVKWISENQGVFKKKKKNVYVVSFTLLHFTDNISNTDSLLTVLIAGEAELWVLHMNLPVTYTLTASHLTHYVINLQITLHINLPVTLHINLPITLHINLPVTIHFNLPVTLHINWQSPYTLTASHPTSASHLTC